MVDLRTVLIEFQVLIDFKDDTHKSSNAMSELAAGNRPRLHGQHAMVFGHTRLKGPRYVISFEFREVGVCVSVAGLI